MASFYRQERVTKCGKLYKFRTMVSHVDQLGLLITTKNDKKLQKSSFNRKYRLDEIPQLLIIIEGYMSFVAARPVILKYVAQYTDKMKITL